MCRRASLVVVVAAMMFAAAWSHAASVFVSRSTALSASGRTSADSFDLADSLTTFGPYDNTIGDSIVVPEGGTTRAQASQQSDVAGPAAGAGFARGAAEAQVAEFDAIAAQAESSFEVVFDVLGSSELLTLSGSVDSTFDGSARVAVLPGAGGDPIFERLVGFGEQEMLTFDESLTLAPGRYSLVAEGIVTGTPAPNTADFDVMFSVSNPIPLPPALWAGATGLVVAWMYARRMGRR